MFKVIHKVLRAHVGICIIFVLLLRSTKDECVFGGSYSKSGYSSTGTTLYITTNERALHFTTFDNYFL